MLDVLPEVENVDLSSPGSQELSWIEKIKETGFYDSKSQDYIRKQLIEKFGTNEWKVWLVDNIARETQTMKVLRIFGVFNDELLIEDMSLLARLIALPQIAGVDERSTRSEVLGIMLKFSRISKDVPEDKTVLNLKEGVRLLSQQVESSGDSYSAFQHQTRNVCMT
ncbi:hypothetical protein A3K29_02960 [Candidatus Collierbacteria bacterium RIFOXYB2_FULL_46_14]|uniref:Uncharacterized protein n=1 Tax=Candidatus Collierbacteria bacterium GW2011_GWA2_46_26 TaxID=1618381 RepID=A0A0G1PM83_9BACT|nr:MAG: hypothetical protein UW29_C0004G0098 [Candidatus Collierbacteria bacterium GW2011_GWC2_44_13]KKU33851.1 MAG: hypothetical protein UX47_C0001G0134 [Candidatus Collierbacteria bacterium GW2011_GWA2_46_26]OGD73080.1 MAG: hypothetical protein A3K29_02960 [Candidatus Collierbacteria bacterium RIFOXYB2_FULL_46_14]OGD76122.1 MAG: hypothetical protein A3K43_02960 [Candidatus Collierbacteria bacterium RIFOXYA2_FULL_46_20]OGD77458.1 MAG: hypothetical protein A3K39_02960 [Candidatus Collierbacteri